MSPRKSNALFEAGRKGEMVAIFQLQQEFHYMLHGMLGPKLAEGRIDGAYGKFFRDWADLGSGHCVCSRPTRFSRKNNINRASACSMNAVPSSWHKGP